MARGEEGRGRQFGGGAARSGRRSQGGETLRGRTRITVRGMRKRARARVWVWVHRDGPRAPSSEFWICFARPKSAIFTDPRSSESSSRIFSSLRSRCTIFATSWRYWSPSRTGTKMVLASDSVYFPLDGSVGGAVDIEKGGG